MFRVELFCDDRKLADVLRALTGLLIGEPKIQPVVNAEAKNGSVKANGSIGELFMKYATTHHMASFAPIELKPFCRYVGLAESSYAYALEKLIEHKLVKRHGSGRNVRYKVLGA